MSLFLSFKEKLMLFNQINQAKNIFIKAGSGKVKREELFSNLESGTEERIKTEMTESLQNIL